jgi:hypothetical protein
LTDLIITLGFSSISSNSLAPTPTFTITSLTGLSRTRGYLFISGTCIHILTVLELELELQELELSELLELELELEEDTELLDDDELLES